MRRLLVMVSVLSGACGDVELRVCNRTGHDVAHLDAAGHSGVSLAVDECSPYRVATQDAYAFTGASFYIDADYFTFLPLDFLGASPLDPGQWTYDLKISDYGARRCIAVLAREQ